jgi:hypothetical protein
MPELDAPARESTVRFLAGQVRRHLVWARTEGLGRLIEEDQLNPVDRAAVRLSKWRWRLANPRPPGAAAVFLVGLQRSGTNMIVRGLERSPEFAVYNENHRAAFDRFQLRPDPVIRTLVERCRHPYVLLKPLCDSDRIVHLLDELGTSLPRRALWVYRSVDGRVRSAVAKFGDHNLRVLREVAAGRGLDRWQARGLSRDSLERLASLDWTRLSPESAAAMFWYVRNRLFFELGLDRRPDVLLVSYDAMIRDPEAEMHRITGFLDFPYDPRLIAHVAPRAAAGAPALDLDPQVRAWCDELAAALDASHRQRI